jgi:predicted secreted protein
MQGATTVLGPGAYSSYLWSPNAGGVTTPTITASTSGTYTVTVTNAAGCQNSDAIQVIVSPLPSPNILGDNSICVGTTTTFDATNAAYTSYLWSNGFATPTITVSTANTYTVTVTDGNGCSNTDNVVLAVNANPVPVIIGDNTICQGQNTVFDAGPGYTYQWNNGILTQTNTVNTAGPYTVTVTDGNMLYWNRHR